MPETASVAPKAASPQVTASLNNTYDKIFEWASKGPSIDDSIAAFDVMLKTKMYPNIPGVSTEEFEAFVKSNGIRQI